MSPDHAGRPLDFDAPENYKRSRPRDVARRSSMEGCTMAVDDPGGIPLAVRLAAEYARASSLAGLTRETISAAREAVERARIAQASRGGRTLCRSRCRCRISSCGGRP
jgi:hypothetical protein